MKMGIQLVQILVKVYNKSILIEPLTGY